LFGIADQESISSMFFALVFRTKVTFWQLFLLVKKALSYEKNRAKNVDEIDPRKILAWTACAKTFTPSLGIPYLGVSTPR